MAPVASRMGDAVSATSMRRSPRPRATASRPATRSPVRTRSRAPPSASAAPGSSAISVTGRPSASSPV